MLQVTLLVYLQAQAGGIVFIDVIIESTWMKS